MIFKLRLQWVMSTWLDYTTDKKTQDHLMTVLSLLLEDLTYLLYAGQYFTNFDPQIVNSANNVFVYLY